MRLILVSGLNSRGTFFMGGFPQTCQLGLLYQSEQLRTNPWRLIRTRNGHPVFSNQPTKFRNICFFELIIVQISRGGLVIGPCHYDSKLIVASRREIRGCELETLKMDILFERRSYCAVIGHQLRRKQKHHHAPVPSHIYFSNCCSRSSVQFLTSMQVSHTC
jgi:hypothetical protein